MRLKERDQNLQNRVLLVGVRRLDPPNVAGPSHHNEPENPRNQTIYRLEIRRPTVVDPNIEPTPNLHHGSPPRRKDGLAHQRGQPLKEDGGESPALLQKRSDHLLLLRVERETGAHPQKDDLHLLLGSRDTAVRDLLLADGVIHNQTKNHLLRRNKVKKIHHLHLEGGKGLLREVNPVDLHLPPGDHAGVLLPLLLLPNRDVEALPLLPPPARDVRVHLLREDAVEILRPPPEGEEIQSPPSGGRETPPREDDALDPPTATEEVLHPYLEDGTAHLFVEEGTTVLVPAVLRGDGRDRMIVANGDALVLTIGEEAEPGGGVGPGPDQNLGKTVRRRVKLKMKYWI